MSLFSGNRISLDKLPKASKSVTDVSILNMAQPNTDSCFAPSQAGAKLTLSLV